jgi:serine/threonine-protein kinase
VSESIPGTIGKYQIIREIARSNDIVYEAYDPRMNRRVAVKELAMPKGASQQQREDRLKRFEREARAAGSLVHPNIVTIYEVGTDGEKNYIAMEFLTGRNLRKEIDKTGFIEPKHAIEVAIEVLEGLAFAHENGVIHRDIKPDNVQLLDDGQIKLTDFGIARLTFEPNITMDGQVFGTPSYMSPEQINGQEIDARSDLFGVGVLLYEMVSGQKPFQGDSVVSITYAIMNKRPDQPQQANYQLWQVIERSLEKTPDMRYRSAGEFIEALRNVLKGYTTGVFEPNTQPSYAAFNPGQVMPGPPPVYNPHQPSAPPLQQSMPQPGTTPYGTPMPPGMYQPYVPQTYQAPAPSQVPVYYPPPPRQPLVKPEHKQAVANFFIAVLLIGAVIGFMILVINAFSNSVPSLPTGGTQPEGTTEPLANQQPDLPPNAGGPAPIGSERAGTSQPSPVATRTDPPVDVMALVEEAEAQVDTAAGTESPGLRVQMYTDADALFSQAIEAAAERDKRQISLLATSKYIGVANQLLQRGYPDRAREAYRRAKGYAQVDPVLLDEIDAAIEQLGG